RLSLGPRYTEGDLMHLAAAAAAGRRYRESPMPSRPASFFRPRARKGLWFPICAGFLVLLMLPGLILLVLSLAGLEGVVNAWLLARFRVSYHNSLPLGATVLLLLLPVILAILYFLKLRRKAMEVPST